MISRRIGFSSSKSNMPKRCLYVNIRFNSRVEDGTQVCRILNINYSGDLCDLAGGVIDKTENEIAKDAENVSGVALLISLLTVISDALLC